MGENRVLNSTLELLEEKGVKEAYEYILYHKKSIPTPSSQFYNFLYCLAALSDKEDEALDYLEESIVGRGYWYRPEVFQDEDLDSIRHTDRFRKCEDASRIRYKESFDRVNTIITWNHKSKEKILLALHGNQQNLNHSRGHWQFLGEMDYQVEYIQSEEIDSCELFRWEDEGTGPMQLKESMQKMQWDSYEKKTIGGFSAGCNVILRAILEQDISCSSIILQSPWIPVVDNDIGGLVDKIKSKNIQVLIICGTKDLDCLDRSKILFNELINNGNSVKGVWVNDLGHDFPEDFEEIVAEFLNF
ncbi:TPR end-of-group domain-containing protein [Gudongella sp. DL1XJH-153]|uniref:TPR end-of-group domain-containing protein n=1 Tax=Gudongella sp. DL1XJH-153 TaxID=3409804 RepID=UPI003BB6F8BD